MTIAEASGYLFGGAILILVMIMFACLIRAIRGPEIADRIVAVNMLGTLTIMIICILSLWQSESYLLDVALIYAMISFLAVVVLTRVYLGVHREHMKAKENESTAESFLPEESMMAFGEDEPETMAGRPESDGEFRGVEPEGGES